MTSIAVVVGAEASCEFAFLGGRCRCDNPRAQKFSELDGRDADAARGAQYQKDFTFAQVSTFAQRIEPRQIVGLKRGAGFGSDLLGQDF